MSGNEPKYVPTPAEIEASKAAIESAWNEKTKMQRTCNSVSNSRQDGTYRLSGRRAGKTSSE
jgi:hypothetical protein